MVDRFRLSEKYVVDNYCMELVKYHLCNYIILQAKRYIEMGINIYLDFPLKIIYNNHYYWCNIVKEKSTEKYYWLIRGYGEKNLQLKQMKMIQQVLKKLLKL